MNTRFALITAVVMSLLPACGPSAQDIADGIELAEKRAAERELDRMEAEIQALQDAEDLAAEEELAKLGQQLADDIATAESKKKALDAKLATDIQGGERDHYEAQLVDVRGELYDLRKAAKAAGFDL